MSELLLVRHGQAGALVRPDPPLTETGQNHASVLGQFWKIRDLSPTRILSGPRARHIGTAQAAITAMQASQEKPLPEMEVQEAWDEMDASGLLNCWLDWKEQQEPGSGQALREKKEQVKSSREFFAYYRQAVQVWLDGRLQDFGMPPFQEFRQRIAKNLDHLCAEAPAGSTIVVFTSGGPVAAALGWNLGLDDSRIIQLSIQVLNTSVTRFLVSPGRVTLQQFNTIPHLERQDLQPTLL